MPTAQELREMRLGLLVEMVVKDGEPHTAEAYDGVREKRNEGDDDWPRSTGLASHYGTWTFALRAAADIAIAQTAGRIQVTTAPTLAAPHLHEVGDRGGAGAVF